MAASSMAKRRRKNISNASPISPNWCQTTSLTSAIHARPNPPFAARRRRRHGRRIGIRTGFIVDNVFYKHIGFQWPTLSISNHSSCFLGLRVTGGKNTTVGDVIIKTQLPSFERKAR